MKGARKFFDEKGQPYETGGRTPVSGKTLGAASGKALLHRKILQLEPVVIQITNPCVVQKIQPVPGITRTVGHDSQRVPVDMQAVPVRFNDNALTGSVTEGPVKGGDRSHHGDGNQGHVLLQTADRLLNGGALGQQMIHQERRLQGSRMLPALFS